jgi:hypothetical protein
MSLNMAHGRHLADSAPTRSVTGGQPVEGPCALRRKACRCARLLRWQRRPPRSGNQHFELGDFAASRRLQRSSPRGIRAVPNPPAYRVAAYGYGGYDGHGTGSGRYARRGGYDGRFLWPMMVPNVDPRTMAHPQTLIQTLRHERARPCLRRFLFVTMQRASGRRSGHAQTCNHRHH